MAAGAVHVGDEALGQRGAARAPRPRPAVPEGEMAGGEGPQGGEGGSGRCLQVARSIVLREAEEIDYWNAIEVLVLKSLLYNPSILGAPSILAPVTE